jgi:Tol biopolymer transport system component
MSSCPCWSGHRGQRDRRIAFSSERDGDPEIYIMRPDGSRVRQLTVNQGPFDGGPAWSPDGGRIAFDSDRDGNPELYTMRADGSGQTRLTFNEASDFLSTWSPDGRRLAFTTDRDGNVEVTPCALTAASRSTGPRTRLPTSTLTGSHSRKSTIDQATW